MLECYQCVAVLISLHCTLCVGALCVGAVCVEAVCVEAVGVEAVGVEAVCVEGSTCWARTSVLRATCSGSGLCKSALPTLPIQSQMEILCGQMKVILWFLDKFLCKVLYGSDGLQ